MKDAQNVVNEFSTHKSMNTEDPGNKAETNLWDQ